MLPVQRIQRIIYTLQVHPIPPFDDEDALDKVLDYMEQIGLYLIYDMR